MEPFKEQTALVRFGFVSVGPEGGDVDRLAGSERTINFAQSGLGFVLLPFHFERVEQVFACARAEDVRVGFGHPFGEAQVLIKGPASQDKVVRARGRRAPAHIWPA